MEPLALNIQSEIGTLEAVLLHTPGPEVENMTPKDAQRALYSDILNLSIARKEYEQLEGILSKVSRVYQLKDLLLKVLENQQARQELVEKICAAEQAPDYFTQLMDLPAHVLCRVLIEGLPARIDNLTAFLNDDYYALFPLYNFYFTRDAAMVVGNRVLLGKMANTVRLRESLIMEALFKSPQFAAPPLFNPNTASAGTGISIEGGDVLVARHDVLIIGNGTRTSSQGIDFILSQLCRIPQEEPIHILVQQLPAQPESFIHLDMVFTLLDTDKCMVFEPLILEDNRYETIHITVSHGRVGKIKYVQGLLPSLKKLGIDMDAVSCGGTKDEWNQEREQWHSGANFFAIAPGKVLSYARNIHTIEEMNKHGFEVIAAADVLSNKINLNRVKRCVVTLEGSELPRGGGGPRCMTMPLRRKPVKW
ncbi:MAG: arginine deiminase [Prevotellaceae bacterium]|jgi:arginine deiminase|nr:arginine deiminase [Prevotellaceae bacterium]